MSTTCRELTGASVAKRQVEDLAIRAAQDFDAFYEQRAAVRDPKQDLLIISTVREAARATYEELFGRPPPAFARK